MSLAQPLAREVDDDRAPLGLGLWCARGRWAWLAGLSGLLVGCAGMSPTLGRARPVAGVEAAVGGAGRFAFGSLPSRKATGRELAPGAGAAFALPRKVDVGVSVLGGAARVSALHHRWLGRGSTRYGLRYGGYLEGALLDKRGESQLLRGVLVSLLTVDIGGAYGLWAGPRLGSGFANLRDRNSDHALLDVGGVLGFSQGVGPLAIGVELNARWERWQGLGGAASPTGLVLEPACVLRIRPRLGLR